MQTIILFTGGQDKIFMLRVLITGSGGQLAREFIGRLSSAEYQLYAPPEEELDISDELHVKRIFDEVYPDLVLNCAAYNNVDGAEKDYDSAYRVNALGPRLLTAACSETGALLVHYSTDYVFDGEKEGLYTEDDIPNPINKYGETKRAGEVFVAEGDCHSLIFRTSWLYGPGKQNFLRKLMEWAKKNRTLRIVIDQISSPTYTADIVEATLAACDADLEGIYHLSNRGYATRYEVARYLLEKTGFDPLVLPVNTSYFPAGAPRPYFSAMSSGKFETASGHDMPHWKDAIDRYICDSNMETQ
jgi:dTDP-4-dehydrorhamnose reductase